LSPQDLLRWPRPRRIGARPPRAQKALLGRQLSQRRSRRRKKGGKKKFHHRARRIQNRRKQWGRRPRVFRKARLFPPEPKKLPASRRCQLNRTRLPHQRRLPPPPLQPACFRRHVSLRQTPRYRSLSRSRRRNAGLVRRTADARSPNQIASLAARLAVRPRADLVSAADARFLARICDVVQVLSRCRNRDAPKNRSPSVTKAISVIIADSIPGGARDSSSVYSRSLADCSRSGFF